LNTWQLAKQPSRQTAFWPNRRLVQLLTRSQLKISSRLKTSSQLKTRAQLKTSEHLLTVS
jgi:hypothetical protein